MNPDLIALGLLVLTNVLFLGFIYGKMVTRLDAVTGELRNYARRTDRSVESHSTQLMDHSQRIARLEAWRSPTTGMG